MKLKLILSLSILLAANAFSQENNGLLLFYLSGENGVRADYAAGQATPNFLSRVSIIDDGYVGKGIRCELGQRFAYNCLQIPPHDVILVVRLYPSHCQADSGLSPVRTCARRAHTKNQNYPF